MAITLASLTQNTLKSPVITIYGGPGIGKTTFAACAPNPVFLCTEDGMGDLNAVMFPLLQSYEEAIEALDALFYEEHDFQTVCFDSLDWLEPLIWDRVCREHKASNIDDKSALGYGKGYTEATRHWRDFFSKIRSLRDQRNMIVIMIAHSQVVRMEDPMQPAYDTHDLKLHKKAAALAEEVSDVILYAAIKTLTASEDLGFNKTRTRALPTGKRIAYTQGGPAFTAKNRYRLPAEIPLDWNAFAEAMGMPELLNNQP